MGRTALYRKYRSTNLSEVIGQDHITSVLDAALKSGGVSHAYLFTGQRGTGKTSVARILAHEVNEIPYGQDSYDIIEIDAASHGLKEDIKELIEKSVIAPVSEKYKVYIIDEVHSMKHDAFNTFLKLLEEPPEHVIFILATTDPQKLPPTILSRTQRFHFRPVELNKVEKHLESIAKKEKIDISDDAIKIIARRGEGSFRDSISLLDQLSGLGGKIDREAVEGVLGLAPEQKIEDLIGQLIEKDAREIVKILNDLRNGGVAGKTVVEQLTAKLLAGAEENPKFYDLADRVLDVNDKSDIYLKLTAVLGAFCASVTSLRAQRSNPAVNRPESPRRSAPRDDTTKPAEPLLSKPIKPVVIETASTVKELTKPYNGAVNWDDVVDEVKKANPPYGIALATAGHDFDGETLTLYFNSKIYRTQSKDTKRKNAIKDAFMSLYDFCPKIEVSDSPKPKSQAVSAVADIMGGGELI